MRDLIDRQDVIDELRRDISLTFISSVVEMLVVRVKNLPSAQPEIVRCRDCLMHGVCRFEHGLGLNGYCSQAERRADETD